ncbi:MAG: TVP38/TMEM64 family protein [Syntrophus sp. (in: bacteria)]|nr:TVP38/TMEM64 family protein [Syntrophus sp. (in: bacteria)]
MNKRSLVESRTLSLILRIATAFFIIILLALIFYVYHEGGWREIMDFYRYLLSPRRLRLFIASFGPFAAVAFVVVQALQVVFAPIPGEVTGFVGGFLFGNVVGTILSTIGLTLGSVMAFSISRYFGMRFVEKVVKKTYIEKFNFFVTHKGLYISYILFLIPGFPKDSLCWLLGLTHMRFLDFFLMNFLGRLPGTVILTFQGSAVKDERYKFFLILLIVSAVLTVVLYFSRNHIIRFFSHVIKKVKKKKIDDHSKHHPAARKKVK